MTYDEINCWEAQSIGPQIWKTSGLTQKGKHGLEIFLKINKRTFYKTEPILTSTNCVRHKIINISSKRIYSKGYQYPQIHEKEIGKQIDEILQQEVIVPSKSPHSSLLWTLSKKYEDNENKWGILIDYRNLNRINRGW